MRKNGYRPTVSDFVCSGQQLTLSAAGEFDKRFHILDSDGKVAGRRATTGWTGVCMDRAKRGISRKARIRARKEAQ